MDVTLNGGTSQLGVSSTRTFTLAFPRYRSAVSLHWSGLPFGRKRPCFIASRSRLVSYGVHGRCKCAPLWMAPISCSWTLIMD